MKVWVVTEKGLTGTENQCLGVAQALGIVPEIKRIGLRQPWKSLTPWLGFECGLTFTGDPLTPPWPDILIAAGRKSVAASRYIKRKSKGKTFTVQLQDPRCNPKQFDLVAVPAHDRLRGGNVIVTAATPNRVDEPALEQAVKDFPHLQHIKQPRVAVLIGGNSKAHSMTESVMRTLAAMLKSLSRNYGLMVTTSRRTGEDNEKILREELAGTDALIWDGKGQNPYYGYLAWSDFIIVTNDSASMISEALTTGRPTYMVRLAGGSPRFDRLHDELVESGMIRRFVGKLDAYRYTPLADAAMVADEIRRHILDKKT